MSFYSIFICIDCGESSSSLKEKMDHELLCLKKDKFDFPFGKLKLTFSDSDMCLRSHYEDSDEFELLEWVVEEEE